MSDPFADFPKSVEDKCQISGKGSYYWASSVDRWRERWEPEIRKTVETLHAQLQACEMSHRIMLQKNNELLGRLEAVKNVLKYLKERIDFLERTSRTHGMSEIQRFRQDERIRIAEKLRAALGEGPHDV